MKSRIFFVILFIGLFPATGSAGDYMVELFKENYKSQMIVGGGENKIYHTWQVKTEFGDKCLLIVGNDQKYRHWLRQYTGKNKFFIIKVPEEGDERFKYDMAVPVNVQQIHAVWDKYWECGECRHGPPPVDPSKVSGNPFSEASGPGMSGQ